MAGGNIRISPDEMREASTWLQNQKELMQQSLHEANTKMDEMVEAAYATPGSESKFRPYWEGSQERHREGDRGPEGVSEVIKQVADAFVDTDDQTSGSIGDLCPHVRPRSPREGGAGRPKQERRHRWVASAFPCRI